MVPPELPPDAPGELDTTDFLQSVSPPKSPAAWELVDLNDVGIMAPLSGSGEEGEPGEVDEPGVLKEPVLLRSMLTMTDATLVPDERFSKLHEAKDSGCDWLFNEFTNEAVKLLHSAFECELYSKDGFTYIMM